MQSTTADVSRYFLCQFIYFFYFSHNNLRSFAQLTFEKIKIKYSRTRNVQTKSLGQKQPQVRRDWKAARKTAQVSPSNASSRNFTAILGASAGYGNKLGYWALGYWRAGARECLRCGICLCWLSNSIAHWSPPVHLVRRIVRSVCWLSRLQCHCCSSGRSAGFLG